MKIEIWPINVIRPYEKNPRRNDPGVDAWRSRFRNSAFGSRLWCRVGQVRGQLAGKIGEGGSASVPPVSSRH